MLGIDSQLSLSKGGEGT